MAGNNTNSTIFNVAQLTPVKLVATGNVTATYNNGTANNGVGATLVVAATSLTVDSVLVALNDRLLLPNQTSTFQNGIYKVTDISATVTLTRAGDFHSIEQMQLGANVTAFAGTANAGRIFTFVSPKPGLIGTDAITWSGPEAAVSGATVVNQVVVAADTIGTIKASSGSTATVGEPLIVAGNVTAGLTAGGTPGTFIAFPTTTATGSLILAPVVNSGGNFNTTISNASSVGQSQVVSIPDGGVATSNFLISNSAGTQTVATGSIALTAGNLTAGSSGHAGTVTSFPGTAAQGSLILAGVNNATGNFTTTVSNAAAVAQSQVVSIPDGGGATSNFLLSATASHTQSATGNILLTGNPLTVTKVVTCGQAALASAGKVNVWVPVTGTAQVAILDIKVFFSTGLSGGGGNRLLALSDGTIVFNNAGITAAVLGTPIFTIWGGTGNPITASGVASVSTAGATLFLQYTGGTTDYTAGSVIISVTYAQVTT